MTDAWGQPAPQQQGYPAQPGYPQQQGYPAQQGDPWGGAQAAAPVEQAPDVGSLLGAGNSGPWGPSFKFVWDPAQSAGNGVLGTVVAVKAVPKTDPGSDVQKLDRRGQKLWQIAVTLRTALRGWSSVSKQPTQKVNGQEVPIPPSEDTGLRNVYLWYTSRDAVAEAMTAAGADLAAGIPVGSVLGLRVVGTEPNPKGGQDIKKFQAIFYLPGQVPPEIQQRLDAAPQPPAATPPQYPAQPPAQPTAPPQGYPAQPPAAPPQAFQPPQGPPPGFAPGPGQDQPPF